MANNASMIRYSPQALVVTLTQAINLSSACINPSKTHFVGETIPSHILLYRIGFVQQIKTSVQTIKKTFSLRSNQKKKSTDVSIDGQQKNRVFRLQMLRTGTASTMSRHLGAFWASTVVLMKWDTSWYRLSSMASMRMLSLSSSHINNFLTIMKPK